MPKMLDSILRKLGARAVPGPSGRSRPASEGPTDECFVGCGWFDSSHELERGLSVREAGPELLPELPLADWLAFHECGLCTSH
jgi:hypothetical protein